jgi:RHS repeat-associated protein
VLAAEDALGDILWSLSDYQGTVRDLVDYNATTNTTAIVNHRQYDAFGNITNESNPSAKFLYAYTGREWDADVDIYYYRARWYDPAVGRFLSEDPIGFAAGDTNLQRYVSNSSTIFVDPSGLQHDLAVGAIVFDDRPTYEDIGTNGIDTINDMLYLGFGTLNSLLFCHDRLEADKDYKDRVQKIIENRKIAAGELPPLDGTVIAVMPDWIGGPGPVKGANSVRSAIRGTMPWTGSFSSKPWKGKFGNFAFGSAHSGHGVSTFLAHDGTLEVKFVIAKSTDLVIKRGLDGRGLLEMAIKYHGMQNIKRISASFGADCVRESSRANRWATNMDANWKFFLRHRDNLGNYEAIKRSPSIREFLKHGFTDLEITKLSNESVEFTLRKPGIN